MSMQWRGFSRRTARCLCLSALLFLPVLSSGQVQADGQDTVAQVKAAFLLNIARFVRWPEPSAADVGGDAAFNLCLYKQDTLDAALGQIQGRNIGAMSLRSEVVDDLQAATHCQLLYIAEHTLGEFQLEVSGGATSTALTVLDLTGMSRPVDMPDGVILALKRRGGRIGFAINLALAKQAGLNFSSELLKLADIEGAEK